MADVNEEIVAQYLSTTRKWFCIVDIPFQVPRNYSNIDVLAFDPKANIYYDIEVKFRSKYTMAAKSKTGKDISKKSVAWLVEQFTKHKSREKKIKDITGGHSARKLLVTTKQLFGKSATKRAALEAAFLGEMKKKSYEAEILYFDDIIPELKTVVGVQGRFNTQLLQTIRMLNTYV